MKTQSRLQFLISLILCALFCAVIAVSAQLIIPGVIPFTMQTFAVFLTVAVLGTAWGSVSVLAYLCLGLIGAPVFAGFHGGIGVLFGATGGYLIGFLPAVVLTGLLLRFFGKNLLLRFFSMLAGLGLVYLFGTVWFVLVYTPQTGQSGLWYALAKCVFPYILPDAVKLFLAALLGGKLQKLVRRK